MPVPVQLLFDLGLEDLNPIEVGECDNFPERSVFPKSFNGTIIHYVRRGYGNLYSRGEHYSVGPGQAFIILPGEENHVHYTSDSANPWEYAWVSFTGKLAPRFSVLPPVFDVPEDTFLHTRDLKNATDTIGYLLAADLYALYAKVVDPMYHKQDILPSIIEHIEQNYMQKLTVEDIGARFGLDRRDLSRRFKARTGLCVRAYLTRVRMKHAEALLEEGRSVKDIASRCGFSNSSNFHKLFTAHHGLTPIQWKAQYQTGK